MKNLIHTAVVTLLAASAAHAQQAVQWKVSDGGNGHWYQIVQRTYGTYDWTQTRAACIAIGGDLASFETSAEWAFMRSRCRELPPGPVNSGQLLAGGRRSAGASSQWTWLTGQTFSYFAWNSGAPNDGTGQELVLCVGSGIGSVSAFDGWDDWRVVDLSSGYVIEWSADCNHDGIVDYGQCHDGTLPDYNGNNIPDCCERGEGCVVGNYPVQWRVEDGGNGHWYSGVDLGHPVFWIEARDMASASGGHLATPSTAGEDHFLVTTFLATARLYRPDYSCCEGPYIGAFNEGAGWKWVDGTPWSYTNWYPGNPNEIPFTVVVYWSRPECQWQDQNDIYQQYKATAYIVEWSTDCNNDGVVDKGQILAGQLADLNGNGIPDICEGPTCRDADLFRNGVINGADLGILLSEWGPANVNTVSDINRDGVVNGADLGFLLANWGPCQN